MIAIGLYREVERLPRQAALPALPEQPTRY